MSIPINHFNRSKIFYPHAINYIVTLHGLIDLFSRALTIELEKISNRADKEKIIQNLNLKDKDRSDFLAHDGKRPLIGKISLKSICQGNNVEVDINEIVSELIGHYDYLLPYQVKAAGNLFIMCYEVSKDKYDDKSSIWNFFYHARNAAAHGGIFNITNIKRFPAKWGIMEITQKLNGTNLFIAPPEQGLISLGDPIRLLWDIEQAYMK